MPSLKERYEQLSTFELRKMAIEARAWIDGPENDGRLTTGSSAQLDCMMDDLEIAESILADRTWPEPFEQGREAVRTMKKEGKVFPPNCPFPSGTPQWISYMRGVAHEDRMAKYVYPPLPHETSSDWNLGFTTGRRYTATQRRVYLSHIGLKHTDNLTKFQDDSVTFGL